MSQSKPALTSAPLIIAIDGPAGAGKSTVALALAQRFSLLNIESGAMYRAFALKALTAGVPTSDPAALDALAHATDVHLEPSLDGNRILLDGADVTAQLRTPEITAAATVAAMGFMPSLRNMVMPGMLQVTCHSR